MATVLDAAGRAHEIVRCWPDGSYTCPCCGYAVCAPRDGERQACRNPACPAGRDEYTGRYYQSPASIAAAEAAAEQRKARDERAARDARSIRDYHESAARERKERAAATLQEAISRGACTHRKCLNLSGYGPVKFVRHRAECPQARAERFRLECEESLRAAHV